MNDDNNITPFPWERSKSRRDLINTLEKGREQTLAKLLAEFGEDELKEPWDDNIAAVTLLELARDITKLISFVEGKWRLSEEGEAQFREFAEMPTEPMPQAYIIWALNELRHDIALLTLAIHEKE